jgi:hypothetical protein
VQNCIFRDQKQDFAAKYAAISAQSARFREAQSPVALRIEGMQPFRVELRPITKGVKPCPTAKFPSG